MVAKIGLVAIKDPVRVKSLYLNYFIIFCKPLYIKQIKGF